MKPHLGSAKNISLVCAATILLGVVLLWPTPGGSESVGAPNQAKTAASDEVVLVGTATCSARGCHGGIEPRNPERRADTCRQAPCDQNEYGRWLRDSHAQAYAVLHEPRSQQMARMLGDKPAHENERCLACHASPLLLRLPTSDPLVRAERVFGVGCESCHENAKDWLGRHTAADWCNLDAKQKSDFGMADLADPGVRAAICAGCHVGAAPVPDAKEPRDVNHDLLAAGHPRLNFEFGAYQANMPSHWRSKPTSDTHFWVAGQLASARAALDLLAYRANETNGRPWPEFAEYDCFSCHHDLTVASWRQKKPRDGRTAGGLSWGSWHFAVSRQVTGPLHDLDTLDALMHQRNPERAAVTTGAILASKALRRSAKKVGSSAYWQDGANTRKLIEDLTQKTPIESWDSAEQVYLALHALRPALANPALVDELTMLRFIPQGFDSPSSWRPDEFIRKVRQFQAVKD